MSFLNEITVPTKNEFSLYLFGTGRGECIIIHCGDSNWIQIDSFINPETKNPIAVDFFRELGIPIQNCLKLILLTHFHDDHFKGVAETFRVASSSKLALSSALKKDEFKALLVQASLRHLRVEGLSSGLDEINKISEVVGEIPGRKNDRIWAIKGRTLWNEAFPGRRKFVALSPDDRQIDNVFQNLSGKEGTQIRPIAEPNESSVVTLLDNGDDSFLFGADLEKGSPRSNSGWHAVLASFLELGLKKASYFKIPHHGSIGAMLTEVWNKCVEEEHVSTLTPNQSGGLPTIEGEKFLKTHSKKIYLAGRHNMKTVSGSDFRYKTEGIRNIRLEQQKLGLVRYVQIRKSIFRKIASWDFHSRTEHKITCFGQHRALHNEKDIRLGGN